MLGIKVNFIIEKAKNYKNMERFNYQDPERAEKKRKIYITSGYGQKLERFMTDFLRIKDNNELIEFLNRNRQYLKNTRRFTEYLINMYPHDYKEKIADVEAKLSVWQNYLTEQAQKKKEERITYELPVKAFEIAFEILRDRETRTITDAIQKYAIGRNNKDLFVEQWMSIQTFVKDEGEKEGSFVSLYNQIVKVLKDNRDRYYRNNYEEVISKVLELVNKPIKIGNDTRSFDRLDCYTYFRESFGTINKIITEYFPYDNNPNNQEMIDSIVTLKKLLDLNGYYNSIDAVYEPKKDLLDIEKFADIPSSLIKIHLKKIFFSKINSPLLKRELTYQEKENIIDEMIKNNIPITFDAFMLCVNRYYNGHLELITKDSIDNYIRENIYSANIYSSMLERELTKEEKASIIDDMIKNNTPITINAFISFASKRYNSHMELLVNEQKRTLK